MISLTEERSFSKLLRNGQPGKWKDVLRFATVAIGEAGGEKSILRWSATASSTCAHDNMRTTDRQRLGASHDERNKGKKERKKENKQQ